MPEIAAGAPQTAPELSPGKSPARVTAEAPAREQGSPNGHIALPYGEFLASKRIASRDAGLSVDPGALHPLLHPFQRHITDWALRKGKAAVFADCGLGKSPIQLQWAQQVHEHSGRDVLILAPLAVSKQTVREGVKFDVPVNICRRQEDVRPGVNIANYEMLQHFDPAEFGGIVLDESSCLKSYSSVYRQQITEFASSLPYRLACTATPAPNDLIELINHAEFLSVMQGKEIIALFFTQDGNSSHDYRLKGHARRDFWRWLASWSVALRKPSDLGYSDDGFRLPKLHIHEHVVEGPPPVDRLFPVEAQTLLERRQARKGSTAERVRRAADLVKAEPGEPWIVWCDLNRESEALTKAIPGAVEVRGSDTPEHKEKAMLDFADGGILPLVSKPSICGWGMNWHHCAREVFVGLSDSFEQFYQAVRRAWRYGQTREVHVHIVISDREGAVRANIERKERQAAEMFEQIVRHMGEYNADRTQRQEMEVEEAEAFGAGWQLYLGDTYDAMDRIEDESVGLSLFSPPFPGMYAYTNSVHDLGNTTHIDQMIDHFRYFVGSDKLLRITVPGRLCCIHLSQLTAMKGRDGYIGIKDYRGRVIAMMEQAGWLYTGEVTIDKNPQIKATRNKERGLLFKSLSTDSAVMRMALADYLIYFRKPGENPRPIRAGISDKYNAGDGWITQQEWIEWAAPVWYRQSKEYPGGIRETDVLNVSQARETDDERHLCPLQLGVIERAVKLWSAPSDLVFDPFSGIGSTGYQAIRLGRRFVGCELKRSYFDAAVRNLRRAERAKLQPGLFDEVAQP